MNHNNSKGTSDMPEPEVINYNTFYKVTPIFINDLHIVLGEVAYADAQKFFNMIASYNNILPVSAVNELLRMLSTMPYKYVAPLMNAVNVEENFKKYFEEMQLQNSSQGQETQEKQEKN